MNRLLKIGLFGVVAWLIPFVFSFFFFTPDGGLLIDEIFFKSIMVVTGTAVAAVLLILYFKKFAGDYFREGIVLGVTWFAINILLDVIVLVPMAGMEISTYFTEIGLRYLSIPIISIAVGYIAQSK